MKTHVTLRLLFAVAANSLTLAFAVATPVSYDESVGGDLPHFGSPLPTFAFDIGTNTVTGATRFDAIHPDDWDSFALTLPVRAQLISGQVDLVDASGDFWDATWFLNSGSANWSQGANLETIFSLSPGNAALSSVPLADGVYNMSAFLLDGTPPAYANYAFTFDVRAVPEPSSCMLHAAGIVTLACLARRRKA